jgi:Leucine-rich repeat (LRR) protein
MFRQKYSFTYVFSDNLISKVDTLEPAKLARLHTLELRGNKLTTTDGFNLPNLKNLFLVRY